MIAHARRNAGDDMTCNKMARRFAKSLWSNEHDSTIDIQPATAQAETGSTTYSSATGITVQARQDVVQERRHTSG